MQLSHLTPNHIKLMNSLIPTEIPEPETVTIEQMFEFAKWAKSKPDLYWDYESGWFQWVPDNPKFPDESGRFPLVGEGCDTDLWKKFQEEKQKV